MSSEPTISIMLNTTEHRGDHMAEVCRVVVVPPKTTIRELVDLCLCDQPVLPALGEVGGYRWHDYLVIRAGKP